MGDADTSVLGGHAVSSGAAAVAAAGGKLTAAGATIGNWALNALSTISSRLISSSTALAAAAQHATQAASGRPRLLLGICCEQIGYKTKLTREITFLPIKGASMSSSALNNGHQTAGSEQQSSGPMTSSLPAAAADAATTKKPNLALSMMEWEEEGGKDDTKGKQKESAGSGWDDLDDEDEGEGELLFLIAWIALAPGVQL